MQKIRRLKLIKDKTKRARARALLKTPLALQKGGRAKKAKLMYEKLKAKHRFKLQKIGSRQKRSGENE